jgi:hypothetical protein
MLAHSSVAQAWYRAVSRPKCVSFLKKAFFTRGCVLFVTRAVARDVDSRLTTRGRQRTVGDRHVRTTVRHCAWRLYGNLVDFQAAMLYSTSANTSSSSRNGHDDVRNLR